MDLLRARWAGGHFVCVGLDSELGKIPMAVAMSDVEETIFQFNKAIVRETFGLVCAYKPNLAFYEVHGAMGWRALARTIHFIHDIAPWVPVILDAKRGDIGNTNEMYAMAAFGDLNADAITIHPYLGEEANLPFLKRADKGVFVLCRTSNPGAGEFQDVHVKCASGTEPGKIISRKLYEVVASHVAHGWNKLGNCGLVAGATVGAGGYTLPYVLVLVNRSGLTEVNGKKIIALIDRAMPTWQPAACPRCMAGSEAIRPKGGEEWARLNAVY